MIASNDRPTSPTPPPPVPEHFVTLGEIADRADRKPNVLRKHHVLNWKARGLAMRETVRGKGRGGWWCDPSVLDDLAERLKRRRQGGQGRKTLEQEQLDRSKRRAAYADDCELGKLDRKRFVAAERHIEQAIDALISNAPKPSVPWPLVEKLGSLARQCRHYAKAPEEAAAAAARSKGRERVEIEKKAGKGARP